MRRPVLRGSMILSLIAAVGLVLPATAIARPPSHATLHFKVPSTIGLFDPSSTSTTAQVVVSWTQGSSNTGAECCTNRVYDDGTLVRRTSRTRVQTTVHVGGYEIGPFTIDSYDAPGKFVGSALADPAFANDFEDAYINDHGSDCDTPESGFSGSWAQLISGNQEGGGSCLSTTAGDRFTVSSGIDNAWITTTGPNRGSARIYIDGKYLQTVSTYSKTTHYRRLVWAHRFGSLGGHTITIVNAGTHGHPGIEVDADIFMSVD